MRSRILSAIIMFSLLLTSLSSFAGCNGDGKETEAPSDTATESEIVSSTETETKTEIESPSINETDKSTETESESKEDISETSAQTESDTVTESAAMTESSSESGSESESGSSSASETDETCETELDLDSIVYENGKEITQAGYSWDEDAFVLIDHTFDQSKAKDVTAEELKSLLSDRDAERDGEVYRLVEPLRLDPDTKYYGNSATIIATKGVIIENADNVVLKEIILQGDITVTSSSNVTFFKLDVKGGDVAVKIDEKSSDIFFKQCSISASGTAISSSANHTTVHLSKLIAESGIISTADDLAVQDSHIVAVSLGISSSGKYGVIRENTLELASLGVGVRLSAGAYNSLVALNLVKDAQRSIEISGAFNCTLLLNSAIRIIADGNKNLYVVENRLGGAIELSNNQYLLCDGNIFNTDAKPHPTVAVGNTDFNGDNLHDVDARVEYGANEELLPHTNKDLFLDMERRITVTDLNDIRANNLSNYLKLHAKEESIVIVPPGVYNVDSKIDIMAAHSNTTIYGYGAYEEVTELTHAFQIKDAQNVTVKGMTFGYTLPSSGQIYVLEKLGNKQILAINAAGYREGFGKSDKQIYNGGNSYTYNPGEVSPWHNMSGNYKIVKENIDGTLVIEFTGDDAAKYYGTLTEGSIITCRMAGDNKYSIAIAGSTNVLFKDCVLYGYTAALAITANGRTSGASLERFHNAAHSPYIIDKATYDKYIALEEKYGVDLEVSIDEEGRYRGSIPRMGSVDATHITGTVEGVDATSCLFEQMCDDGSNQRGSSSRIAGIVDNKDGTTTVYYKGTLSATYFTIHVQDNAKTAAPSMMQVAAKGDHVFAYAPDGTILFDTNTLTDSVPAKDLKCAICHTDDADGDGICDDGFCDTCGTVTHYDLNRDDRCDSCSAPVHTHTTGDGKCGGVFWDEGFTKVAYCREEISDNNGDGLNDSDGLPLITAKSQNVRYDASKGVLTYQRSYTKDGGKTFPIISYSTNVYEFTLPTDKVNFDAVYGYDLLDNEEKMDQKVIIDNLSRNSAGFTFDNVMVRNTSARGVLAKTSDVTIKHCTFRNLSSSGILLSVETSWGESTVPRNITILSCLFDNTTHMPYFKNNSGYAPIVIHGLGELSLGATISESTLPCNNITVEGCRFTNIAQTMVMNISAAQNIKIKNNVFEPHTAAVGGSIGRIIINGAINVEFSGNTYPSLAGGDITKVITCRNYKNVFGDDVTAADGSMIFPGDITSDWS
ncbi:MAG: right-handed parallel beta-helix repeat-containing protein [Clostridia bacterium]|nr:right-handed parallel beta-helix repeat-containing protein [Clostridia bacterium]